MMSNANEINLTFETPENFIQYGKERLLESLMSVLNKINNKYIIRTHGMNEKIYTLLGFRDVEEIKGKLKDKSIKELKPYIAILVNNIFNSLNNRDSFVSRCFKGYSWENERRDLNIKLELNKYSSFEENSKYMAIELSIMSLGHESRCGSGDGFTFDLIDSEKLQQIIEKVKLLDVPESIKLEYFEYFNGCTEDELYIEKAKSSIIDWLCDDIEYFMYDEEENLKHYGTLKKLNFKEQLEKHLINDKDISKIMDSIELKYRKHKASSYDAIMKNCEEGELLEDENSLEIYFLDEKIKTISKSSYTVYELHY